MSIDTGSAPARVHRGVGIAALAVGALALLVAVLLLGAALAGFFPGMALLALIPLAGLLAALASVGVIVGIVGIAISRPRGNAIIGGAMSGVTLLAALFVLLRGMPMLS